MDFNDWISEIKKLCNNEDLFKYFNAKYNFYHSYTVDDSPKEAFNMCNKWYRSEFENK